MEHRGHLSGGNELGDFLRARRAALDPHRLNLPDDGRLRRVPGLRREELAQLAHVSVDYVVRLEQGPYPRRPRPDRTGGRTQRPRAGLQHLVGKPPDSRPRQLSKTYRHPIVGALTLDVQQLTVDTQPDQHLVAYTAPPDSPSREALRFLLQWSAPSDNPSVRGESDACAPSLPLGSAPRRPGPRHHLSP
jgi:hypothetical protein